MASGNVTEDYEAMEPKDPITLCNKLNPSVTYTKSITPLNNSDNCETVRIGQHLGFIWNWINQERIILV